jgi:hypothetical protein
MKTLIHTSTSATSVYATDTTAQRAHIPVLDTSIFNNGISAVTGAVNNHAEKIDRLSYELQELRGFYHWITDTYPEHMKQYRALLDLERAGK